MKVFKLVVGALMLLCGFGGCVANILYVSKPDSVFIGIVLIAALLTGYEIFTDDDDRRQ